MDIQQDCNDIQQNYIGTVMKILQEYIGTILGLYWDCVYVLCCVVFLVWY